MFWSQWSSTEKLVAQEWLERESKKSKLGSKCSCCPRCCYSRVCVHSLYMYSGALCLVSLAVFIVLGAGVVAPFHKSLRFIETNCTPISVTYGNAPRPCMCASRHCRSSYPCVKLNVGFNTSKGYMETFLYHTQYDTGGCTYNPKCRRSQESNIEAVEDFVSEYRNMNSTFECLYDPHNTDLVIMRRDGDHHGMLHLLLWPALVLVLSIICLLVPFMFCGCRFLWSRRPPQSIREEALNRARGITTSQYLQMEETNEA